MNIEAVKDDHTMGESLRAYIEPKIHEALLETKGIKRIVVRATYFHRDGIISRKEKTDKRFNFKRPTVTFEHGDKGLTAYMNCFPGSQYAAHYYQMISYYFENFRKGKLPEIQYYIPRADLVHAFQNSNLSEAPKKRDVVIIGYVEQLHGLTNHKPFKGDGDYQWSTGTIGDKKIMLLGSKVSFWGDSGGMLAQNLRDQGHRMLIYVGKLGSMNPQHVPNHSLATGGVTHLAFPNSVRWKNIFQHAVGSNVYNGEHITCESVLDETMRWRRLSHHGMGTEFVDPEIGFMAKWINDDKMGFSYLHIITDNLYGGYAHNLTTERVAEVRDARAGLFRQIEQIIRDTLEETPRKELRSFAPQIVYG